MYCSSEQVEKTVRNCDCDCLLKMGSSKHHLFRSEMIIFFNILKWIQITWSWGLSCCQTCTKMHQLMRTQIFGNLMESWIDRQIFGHHKYFKDESVNEECIYLEIWGHLVRWLWNLFILHEQCGSVNFHFMQASFDLYSTRQIFGHHKYYRDAIVTMY